MGGLISPICNGALVTSLSVDPAAFEQHLLFPNLLCMLCFDYTASAEAAADK